MENLLRAKEVLAREGCTCVLCRGEAILISRERGVKPLYRWLTEGADAKGASAADKVVGRATAFLYCLLGVKAVHAQVMSTPAKQVLEDHGITALCDKEVPSIINRRGDGPCPFEAAVWDIREPEEALAAIRAKLEAMGLI